ncbi:MAG: cell division protein FtsL [Treponema sp.]|jgi:cell division protein FtsL|nr:cell division protein FtsL [Treponema sp.]
MARYYVLFFLMILTIPLCLGLNAWQSNECGKIRNDIKNIEKVQEKRVSENKTVANEIAELQSTERLEAEAQKMGLRKKRPEDVILIIMGGKGRGY